MNPIEAFEVSILAVFVVVNSAIAVLLITRAFARIVAQHLADRRLSKSAAGLEEPAARGVQTQSLELL